MLSVGLTGNVASGKSTVADLWRAAGVPVVSADRLARDVVLPGSPGLDEVVDLLGSEVLRDDGTMDRARVRDLVFRDPEARRALEGILHPRIAAHRDAWLREVERAGHAMAVAEVPLLFEAGVAASFDVTVFVDASEEERLRRLVRERGLEPGEARRIMQAQLDPAVKRRLADHVLENDGTLEELRARAMDLLERLRRQAAAMGS